MAGIRLSIPWDAKEHWLETLLLPALCIVAGFSLICLELLLIERAVPGLVPHMWSLPLSLAILILGTYLGTLQYYTDINYSTRLIELLVLMTAAAMIGTRNLPNAATLWVTLGCVIGAWVLAMNFSYNLRYIWPELKADLPPGTLRDIIDKANANRRQKHDENIDIFVNDFAAFIVKLGKVFLASVVMSSLIRPGKTEDIDSLILSSSAMAVFVICGIGAYSLVKYIEARYSGTAAGVKYHSSLSSGWVRGIVGFIVPIAVIAVLLPAAVSPIASSDLNGISDIFNGAMGSFTDLLGKTLLNSLEPPEPIANTRNSFGMMDPVIIFLQGILEVGDRLIETTRFQRNWSLVSTCMIAVAWSLYLSFLGIAAWLAIRLSIMALNKLRKDKIPLPRFPLKELIAIILWPIALYRLIKWIITSLSTLLASWLTGTLSDAGNKGGASLTQLAKLFKVYTQKLPGIPRDPTAFIRYIFMRLVSLARKHGVGNEQGSTAGEYINWLSRRFPHTEDALRAIGHAYERVRYGSKAADEESAKAVQSSFGIVKKAAHGDRR